MSLGFWEGLVLGAICEGVMLWLLVIRPSQGERG